jgi:ankyrin repeat protein/predicted DNA-binding WGR domain protein
MPGFGGIGSSGNGANHPAAAGQPFPSATETKTQIMTILLADPSVRRSIGIGNKWQRTPVHYAAQQRDLLLLRALLVPFDKTEQIELVNKRDVFGRTPLHFAINSAPTTADATFDVERFLLLCGADVNTADNFGCSSLHFALAKVDMDWQIAYDSAHKDEMEAAAKESSTLEQYEASKRQAFLVFLSNVPASAPTDPVETVSNLAVARGVNVHHQDELGRSPLHLAAATGAVVCMSTLLAAMSSDVDRRAALEMNDLDGFTPLACAFERLRPTTISSLIENGASITDTVRARKSAGGETATAQSFFHHALKHQLPGVCQMLLNSNFSRRQAMEDALKLGDLTLSSNLMGRIEVSNESHLLAAPSTASGGETLLHFLAKLDKPFDESAQNIAWRLIENGLDATALDAAGNGAMHYAAEVGNVHVIDFILHHGGSVNQLTRSGESPVLFALKRINDDDRTRCYRVLNYFLNKPETDVTIEDVDGECALSALLSHHCEGLGGDEDFCLWVELLLQRGMDPNRVTIDKIIPTPILPEEVASLSRADSTLPKRPVRLPILSWVSYISNPSLRMALLALLLKYKAPIDSVDEHRDSVVMHLLRRNMEDEVRLVLGLFKTIPNFVTGDVRGKNRIQYAVTAPRNDEFCCMLKQTNTRGQTALHLAISAFGYASFENASVVDLLVSAGADLHAVDGSGRSALDYLADQRSGHIATLLRKRHSKLVARLPTVESDVDENWESPDYESDSAAYIRECEASGKIKKIRRAVEVDEDCNAGSGSYVLSIPSRAPDDSVKGEATGNELNVYLTKVDTSSGPFGVNVFYSMQAVHDKVQNLYILFTNWGRVGETGSFQNTPFKTADEVVVEFKKIFRSKTGNNWDSRENFVRQPKKYALVQRVNFETKISGDVTRSFLQEAFEAQKEHQSADNQDDPMDGSESSPFGSFSSEYPKSLVKLLYGVTDINNFQSMAPKWSSFADSDMPPLPINDELKKAEKTLKELKVHVGERVKLDEEIQKTSDNMTEESTGLLETLSNKHVALSGTISKLCSRYLEVMPYNEYSMGQSVREYHTELDVDTELDRLRQVAEVNQALKIMLGAKLRSRVIHPLEYCVRAMQVKMTPLSSESSEAALLSKYFLNGIHPRDRSSYRVVSICGLERRGERQRMEQFRQSAAYSSAGGDGGIPMNRLLWHGTRRANLMSIFTQGLRIAPSDVDLNGQQFGKGIYFADVASKSLGFSDAYTPDIFSPLYPWQSSKQRFYMLLCEVALGDSESVWRSNSDKTLTKGFHSVLARGKLVPNPDSDVVSPLTGAVVPIGTVGEVGVRVPARDVWGFADITEQNSKPCSWSSPRLELTERGLAWLNQFVRSKKPGETTTKVSEHAYDFFRLNYDITVRVLKCHGDNSSTWEPFDAAVVITTVVNNSHEQPISFEVRRYRAGYHDPPSDKGFTMSWPEYYRPHLNEFVVFNEAQVRIRYIVEVAKDY